MSDLEAKLLDRINQAALTISTVLGETNDRARDQIRYALREFGVEAVEQLVTETLRIEARGGMQTLKGRRRTRGGIFFHLLRNRFPLFAEYQPSDEPLPQAARSKTAPQPKKERKKKKPREVAPMIWEDRAVLLAEAAQEMGEASITITLRGRPGKIARKGNCIVTRMRGKRIPQLLGGLPQPPSETIYTVYIDARQWSRVESAIVNGNDSLIVEGVCTLDQEQGVIAVFAQRTTTKGIAAARKAVQEAKQSTTEATNEPKAQSRDHHIGKVVRLSS